MMLLRIFFVYFWLHFHCGLTAVVDSAVGEKDVQPQTEENLNFLTEFQKKLQEIEETQEFLMVSFSGDLSQICVRDKVAKHLLL